MTNDLSMVVDRLRLIDASGRIGCFLLLVLTGVVLALIWHVRKGRL